jgi:hypothetical protein
MRAILLASTTITTFGARRARQFKKGGVHYISSKYSDA